MTIVFVGLALAIPVLSTAPRWALLALINVALVLGNVAAVVTVPAGSILAVAAAISLRNPMLGLGRDGRRVLQAVQLMAAAALIVTFWSPDQQLAIRTVILWVTFAILLPFTISAYRVDGPKAIGRALLVLSPVLIVQAASTVLFRLQPATEADYYASPRAIYFVGRGASLLNTDLGFNNVVDPERAGGFLFLNCNIASMVMGVAAMVYLSYAAVSRARWPLLVAIALGVGIAFANSKTGWALGIALPIVALLMVSMSKGRNPANRILTLLVGLMGVGLAIQFLSWFGAGYVAASQTTAIPRIQMWSEALRIIAQFPDFGTGFGGWVRTWQEGGVDVRLTPRPAHNWFLQAALDGGLLYLLPTLWYVGSLGRLAVSSLGECVRSALLLPRALASMAVLWMLIHGLGDNTLTYGTIMTLGLLSIAVAILSVDPDAPVEGPPVKPTSRKRPADVVPLAASRSST